MTVFVCRITVLEGVDATVECWIIVSSIIELKKTTFFFHRKCKRRMRVWRNSLQEKMVMLRRNRINKTEQKERCFSLSATIMCQLMIVDLQVTERMRCLQKYSCTLLKLTNIHTYKQTDKLNLYIFPFYYYIPVDFVEQNNS